MNTEPYGITLFCDDIRLEVSGKITLVGCYQNEMNFSAPAPAVLPALAAWINIRIPKAFEFSTVRILAIKDTDGEVEELSSIEVNLTEEEKDQALSTTADDPHGARVSVIGFQLRWAPIRFDAPCYVKIRAYLDGKHEVQAGALKVNFPQPEAPESNL